MKPARSAPAPSAAAAPHRLQLLHAPALHDAAGGLHPLGPNDAALFAVLAIDGPTSREAIAALLWPDAPAESGRVNLRQRLWRFKSRAALVLDVGGNRLALPAPPALVHDLQDLAARLESDPAAGSGELLGGHAYDDNPRLAQWVRQARDRWRAERLEALAAIAERLEREHRIAEALPYAARIAQDDPLAEHAHRRVMRLHYLRGDRGAALAAYDRLRELLRDELGTIPSLESLGLGRLIESSGTCAAPAPAARAVAVLRPPRLVGREAPERRLRDAWATGGVTALVSGEAGIGKSRFIHDMADALEMSLRVQARLGDASVPYAVLGRLVRAALSVRPTLAVPDADLPAWARTELVRIAPELGGAAPTAPLEPVRLAQAARLALRRHETLLLDDLHFADAATLDLLPTLVAPPMRCLLAVRGSEMPETVGAWLRDQTQDSVLHIPLGPLDEAGVDALLRSLALPTIDAQPWAGALMRHTGGHPLFVLETVRELLRSDAPLVAGALPLPSEVGRLIERRFESLSPPALKLLRLAALAGQDCTVDMAAQVLGVDVLALTDPWSELEAARMLDEGGFVHDLIQDVAARSIPRPIARTLHHAIAAFLERRGGEAARIAAHWVEAQQWSAAARHYRAAARAAETASRDSEEAAFNDLAADCHERAHDRINAFKARVAAAEAAICVDASDSVLARAQALLDAATNEEERLDALLIRASCSYASGSDDIGWCSQALDLATRLDEPRKRVKAAAIHAILLVRAGSEEQGLHLFASNLASAMAVPDKARILFLSLYATGLYYCSRFAEAERQYESCAQADEQAGCLGDAMIARAQAGCCSWAIGDPDGASRHGRQALRLWAELGEPTGLAGASTRMQTGLFHVTAGRYGRGLADLEWALVQLLAGKEDHAWVATTRNHLAMAWLRLGQTARARQTLTPARPEQLPAHVEARWIVLHGLIDRQEGRPLSPALATALAGFAKPQPDQFRLSTELHRLILLPVDDAVAAFRRLQAETDGKHPSIALHALVREAQALSVEQRHAEALDAARRACTRAAACCPRDLGPAELGWLLYRVFDEAGAADEADLALRRGVAAIEAALPHVPEAFRDSFLHREPFNRDLLAAARNRLPR